MQKALPEITPKLMCCRTVLKMKLLQQTLQFIGDESSSTDTEYID